MKQQSVGLVLVTELPGGQRVAVLQVRGMFNPEKKDYRETYAGGCQVSCHGKLQEGESDTLALQREAWEELGEAVANEVFAWRSNLVLLTTIEGEKEDAKTYGLFLQDCGFLRKIRLGPATGGLRLVVKGEKILNLREFGKDVGVVHRGTVAMFPDEAEAVAKALELFA